MWGWIMKQLLDNKELRECVGGQVAAGLNVRQVYAIMGALSHIPGDVPAVGILSDAIGLDGTTGGMTDGTIGWGVVTVGGQIP